jgi:hypothetical protein
MYIAVTVTDYSTERNELAFDRFAVDLVKYVESLVSQGYLCST